MLIGIEASRANRPKKTGVEWYAYHLIQALKRLPETAAHSWLLYGNDPLTHGLEKGPDNWHEARLAWPPNYLWTQARLSWEMLRRPPNALFVPAHVLPRILPAKTVVTVHDVGFHRFPHLYKPIQRWYHEWSTRDILKRATTVLTVSEFCKREIVEIYGADPSRILVTPLGIDHERMRPSTQEEQERTLASLRLPRPFFLFVGRWEKKKNLAVLVEAFHRFKARRGLGDPTQLVLAGQPGEGFQEIQAAIAAGAGRDAVRLVSYVSEDAKRDLLSAATAYIQPSWYEGFGLPPLEAMACGTPAICSNAASLPEVVGEENALWFSPDDPEALAAALETVVDQPEQARRLVERGQQWVKQYTWEKTARETFRILVR